MTKKARAALLLFVQRKAIETSRVLMSSAEHLLFTAVHASAAGAHQTVTAAAYADCLPYTSLLMPSFCGWLSHRVSNRFVCETPSSSDDAGAAVTTTTAVAAAVAAAGGGGVRLIHSIESIFDTLCGALEDVAGM